jgi:hypothetical protein
MNEPAVNSRKRRSSVRPVRFCSEESPRTSLQLGHAMSGGLGRCRQTACGTFTWRFRLEPRGDAGFNTPRFRLYDCGVLSAILQGQGLVCGLSGSGPHSLTKSGSVERSGMFCDTRKLT